MHVVGSHKKRHVWFEWLNCWDEDVVCFGTVTAPIPTPKTLSAQYSGRWYNVLYYLSKPIQVRAPAYTCYTIFAVQRPELFHPTPNCLGNFNQLHYSYKYVSEWSDLRNSLFLILIHPVRKLSSPRCFPFLVWPSMMWSAWHLETTSDIEGRRFALSFEPKARDRLIQSYMAWAGFPRRLPLD